MLEKKKFSKKINYDAIKNLFGTSGDSDAGSTVGGGSEAGGGAGDDDGGEPFIGQRYGKKGKRGRLDGPIVTPEPTWRRGGGSRAGSATPSVVESRRGGSPDHVEPEAEPVADEDNAWRSAFQTQEEDDFAGYDEL